jgi:hypothetical protein
MAPITKLEICLISFFVIPFISCNSHNYDINWNSFGKFANYTITIRFWDNFNLNEYRYNLVPSKTKKITVPNGTRYTGEDIPIGLKATIYPNPDKLPDGGLLEIFLYNPEVNQLSNEEFTMKQQDGVEAYFVKFSKNSKRFYAISKDEIIIIKNEIFPDNIEQIFNTISIEDVFYYDESGTNNYNGDERYWGGYIVKNRIDDNYLWLNHELPW